MNILRSGRPIECLLSSVTETHMTPSLQQLTLRLGSDVGGYRDVVHKYYFGDSPAYTALTFAQITGCESVLQAFVWGAFCCFKVSTLVGAFAGGTIGGACGILKARQLRLAGEESQPFTKTIRDYAIRGKSVGEVYSFLLSVVPAIWLGFKVTLVALPVLNITVPLSIIFGALSGVEYAYRGDRSIGYRIIDRVLEYTLVSKFIPGLVEGILMANRERKVPLYPNLKTVDMPQGLQHPLPQRAVLCVSSAELHDNEITKQENYHVYDYEALRSAFLNDENYVFPHNGKPVDWDCVFRLTNHNLQ